MHYVTSSEACSQSSFLILSFPDDFGFEKCLGLLTKGYSARYILILLLVILFIHYFTKHFLCHMSIGHYGHPVIYGLKTLLIILLILFVIRQTYNQEMLNGGTISKLLRYSNGIVGVGF